MEKINFVKMVAAGNDFIVIDNTSGNYQFLAKGWSGLAKTLCDRKYGIGADGILLLERSQNADINMRIFNSDGSEAQMCGNGARCAALYTVRYQMPIVGNKINIQTKAGMLDAFVTSDTVKLKMSDPHSMRLNIKLISGELEIVAYYINTGVPHTIIFVDDLEDVDVASLGKDIRNNSEFSPEGTNVDFVKVLDKDKIAVRTYERGVEAETLACGTGSVASAIMARLIKHSGDSVKNEWSVLTHGGEVLKVYFDKKESNINNVFLEGSAKITYEGSLAVS